MGIREIERKIHEKAAIEKVEYELLADKLEHILKVSREMRKELKSIEKRYKKDIEKNPVNYMKAIEIRRNLGLPEELGVWEWRAKAPLFRKKKFYGKLGLEILELCKARMEETGGILSLGEITLELQKTRPGGAPPIKDIRKSLERLVKEKVIPPLKKLPSGLVIVRLVPIELSEDQQKVLELSAQTGEITVPEIMLNTEWSANRTLEVMSDLEKAGVIIGEEGLTEGKKYFVPGLVSHSN